MCEARFTPFPYLPEHPLCNPSILDNFKLGLAVSGKIQKEREARGLEGGQEAV